MSTNAAIPVRILEEAYRLAKEGIFHGGVDWAAGDIAKALAAAEQRGREEALSRVEATGREIVRRALNGTEKALGDGIIHLAASVRKEAAIRSSSEGKGE